MDAVASWRAQCEAEALPAIDALRAMALEAGPDLAERIKWNAPSFALGGEDRITLGVERKGGVRAVLHRGAARSAAPAGFADTAGLARWPSPDRAVLQFADLAAVTSRRAEVIALFRRWLEAGA